MISNAVKSQIFSILFIFEYIQTFFEDLNKQKEKSKISIANNSYFKDLEIKEKNKQKKVFKWFSKLNLEQKIKICQISNKYITLLISQLYELYKKNNKIIFEPTENFLILLKGEDSKTEIGYETKKDEKYKTSSNSLNLLKSNYFSSYDENFSGNIKDYEENNKIYIDEDEKASLHKNFFRNKID